MSYALIDTTDLTSLGNAIRTKTGGSSNLTVSQMATAVSNISSGSSLPQGIFDFTYNLEYCFYGAVGYAMLKAHKNDMTFTNISDLRGAFRELKPQSITVENATAADILDLSSMTINFQDAGGIGCQQFFMNSWISKTPNFVFKSYTVINSLQAAFNNCFFLTSVDSFMNGLPANGSYPSLQQMFMNCYSLKHIPHLEKLKNSNQSNSATILYYGFQNCFSLEELLNLPVNLYSYNNYIRNTAFVNLYGCSRITFEMNNNSPYTANWQNSTINLTYSVGYIDVNNAMTITNQWVNNTNGVWRDASIPIVNSAATYDQYKNGMYYTTMVEYSRYNHTSAVETINSLPDTSSNGTTNTIKFLGNSGSLTDGGAISNLTSAEIAVATDKGWNVVIV